MMVTFWGAHNEEIMMIREKQMIVVDDSITSLLHDKKKFKNNYNNTYKDYF